MTSSSNARSAVVTGGTQGIGLGIVKRFIRDGWHVIVTARNGDKLKQVAAELGPLAIPVQGDVGVIADVERLAATVKERFGTLDVLVNNAGLMEVFPTIGTPLAEAAAAFDRVSNANVRGSFLAAHALAPMLRSPGGRIINLGSIVAHTGGSVPGFTAYATSKGAVHGLTLALARELAPRGINVYTVAPGFTQDTGQGSSFDEARIAKIVEKIPLGRPGQSADIANAVAWLASPEASYVTGMTLPVNGGWQFYQ